jgi:hypothetical protein
MVPTHAASIQCVLGKFNRVRLHFVCPPEPVETGNPVVFSALNNAHRVELREIDGRLPPFSGSVTTSLERGELDREVAYWCR